MATGIEPVHLLSRKQHEEFQAKAWAFSDDLQKNEVATETILDAVRKGEEAKLTLAYVHRDLFKHLDTTGIDEDRLSVLPRPGTYEGHVPHNTPFDKYKYKDAEGKPKQASFWGMIGERYPCVIQWRKELAAIDDDKTLGEHERVTLKKPIQNSITGFHQKLRDAVALYFAMEDANKMLAGIVTVMYAQDAKKDKNGKPIMEKGKVVKIDDFDRELCIWVCNDADATKIKPFSIRNFLRLVPQENQSYEDFITSNKREAGTDNVKAQFKIETPVMFVQTGVLTVLQYLNAAQQSTNQHEWKSVLNLYRNGSDDDVSNLDALYDKLTLMMEDKDIKKRLEALEGKSRQQAA